MKTPAYPKIKLSNDPRKALLEIASYLQTVNLEHDRQVREAGETLGFWQTKDWLDGLLEIAEECERIGI